jgi:hypothetical protein
MEATCSSETSIHFQRNERRYIPEDINLQVMKYFLRNFIGDYINVDYILGRYVSTYARSAACFVQQKSL